MSNKNMFFAPSGVNTYLANLVAYYPFNSNTNDFSGNGHNGTLVGLPAFNTGKVSNAIDFGNNINLNYVTIPDNDDFSFTNGVTDLPFSFSMWVKIHSFSSFGNWLFNKRNAITGGEEWQLFISSSGQLIVDKFNYNTSGYQEIKTSVSSFSINTWYHICWTDDGTGVIGSSKIYINGVYSVASNLNNGTYTRMNNGISNIYLGTSAWVPGTLALKHKGLIDEAYIWKDRELTPAEITDIYNKGLVGIPLI